MSSIVTLDFAGVPEEFSDQKRARIVVLPVPFEASTSWLEGTKNGPDAILEASQYVEYYDLETKTEVYKNGIHTAEPIHAVTPKEMLSSVEKAVSSFLKRDKFVVILGGEHTVSLGAILAHLKHFSSLTILHMDAHTDLRDSYQGEALSHACVMARVFEMTEDVVMAGIRSMDSSELDNLKKVKDVLYASEFFGVREVVEERRRRFIEKLSSNVYLSFDVDVFDPSIMPSTGTPEPGGLDWYSTLGFLKDVFEKKNVVGFDVVEFSPISGLRAPDFLVAKFIYTLMGYKFAKGSPDNYK